MGEVTGISWTHHTLNIYTGCTKVSEACKFCYAETLSKRNLPNVGKWGPKAPRRPMSENGWKNLRNWDRKAKAAGERRRVFCSSLSDIAEKNETMPEESWPVVAAQRDRLWDEIEKCDGLDFLLLTKRPDHLGELLAARWPGGLPLNIWAGTSVENQEVFDERWPQLAKIPARVRFLSCEPLLSAIDLRLPAVARRAKPEGFDSWPEERREASIQLAARAEYIARFEMPEWVIVGAESGPKARPMDLGWARSLVVQCREHGVAVHVKQIGARPTVSEDTCSLERAIRDGGYEIRDRKGGDPSEWPEDLRVREMPHA